MFEAFLWLCVTLCRYFCLHILLSPHIVSPDNNCPLSINRRHGDVKHCCVSRVLGSQEAQIPNFTKVCWTSGTWSCYTWPYSFKTWWTHYRLAMPFGNRKKIRGYFQFSIVTIYNISSLWKPEINLGLFQSLKFRISMKKSFHFL